jgi:hypothetical protein
MKKTGVTALERQIREIAVSLLGSIKSLELTCTEYLRSELNLTFFYGQRNHKCGQIHIDCTWHWA